ncbi:MAG: magnesium chelatase subunit D [Pseudomonadota bacterium]
MRDGIGRDWSDGGGRPGTARWEDAARAAALLAIDPVGLGGALLTARPGHARSAWLALMEELEPDRPRHRLPGAVPADRLSGGLDLAATLAARRPVEDLGILAKAAGGTLIVPMAERLEPGAAARIAAAHDRSDLCLIALDESEEGRDAPTALADRVAFHLDLGGLARADCGRIPTAKAVTAARARRAAVETPDAVLEALVATAAALGIDSLRAARHALRAAEAHAALAGRTVVEDADAEVAVHLVLAPRAIRLPVPEEESAAPEPPPDSPDDPADDSDRDAQSPRQLEDRLLEAAEAHLPADLLARLLTGGARRTAQAGGAGANVKTSERGRPQGSRRGSPRGGARLDLIETLRAAAPWQPIRRAPGDAKVAVRPDDFRIRRFRRRSESVLIFVVDASGSAAMARLAEAKGAVELLLADAYVRRESVALIAFRGTGAELLLPPTRALVQAKRRLAALPGGGGTPLASGMEAGLALATQMAGRGVTPHLVLLTDGRANIGRDGSPGREAAAEDARTAARALRTAGHGTILIDTGNRASAEAEALAREMGAGYLALPRADAAQLSQQIRAAVSAPTGP